MQKVRRPDSIVIGQLGSTSCRPSTAPLTVEAITFDFTGGVLRPISQVATITVQ